MENPLRSVLLADEDREARGQLAAAIRHEIACVVLEAGSPAEAIALLEQEEVCVLIAGLFPEGGGGTVLLQKVLKEHPEVVPISTVPAGNRSAIVEALHHGAFSYLNHPYDVREAVIATARGLYYRDLLIHKEKKGPKIRKSDGFHGIIGATPGMTRLFDLIDKLAEDGESTVLILGESGTGKELVARAIHARSTRRVRNLVPINCAAIPDHLLESELFGHIKGAFTGADKTKIGRLQYAQGGTLFLDEVGDMKPDLQAKLLRVLQDKEFVPVGAVKPMPADVRIIAATHRDLERMVGEGTFRQDLYYRISVIPVGIPPLRARRDDIPLLIDKFVQVFNRNRRQRLLGFAPEAVASLLEYLWPGNVRELENLVQQMVVLHGGGTVEKGNLPTRYLLRGSTGIDAAAPAGPLPGEIDWGPEGIDFNALVTRFEDHLILRALALANGNKKEAARLLGLQRTTLMGKLRKKDPPPLDLVNFPSKV